MAETLLKIENLTKEYEGQKILDGINLEVKQGDVLVVVGPSGCGKSTLLRCINALEPIQGGTIKLQGMDIRKGSKNITTLRQKIGMVFQSYELFPHLTVLDNITLAPVKVQKRDKAEAQKEAMELLERVGLADKANSYPKTVVRWTKAACSHCPCTVHASGNPAVRRSDRGTGSGNGTRSAWMLCWIWQSRARR